MTLYTVHDSQGHPWKSDEAILSWWLEHYQLVLNHQTAVVSRELDAMSSSAVPDTDIPTDAPTSEEVRWTILKLNNGHTPGADGLPPELLKCAVDSVVEPLLKIFHLVWKTGMVPADWRVIVSLYKGKGPRTECKSHRPMTLLSVPGKVFAHVLLARLEPLLHRKRRPQQSGFTKNRSTLDAVLALCLLSEIQAGPIHTLKMRIHESGLPETAIVLPALSKKDSNGPTSSRMLRFASDQVYRVSSQWFAGAVFLKTEPRIKAENHFCWMYICKDGQL